MMVFLLPLAAAFDSSAWHYVQDVSVPAGTDSPVRMGLGESILDHAQLDGRDIRITENKKEIPYKLFLEPSTVSSQPIRQVHASSARASFRGVSYDADNMFDKDMSMSDGAYYQNDAGLDKATTWVVVDIGTNALTSTALVYTQDSSYSFSDIQVEGSSDGQSWSVVKQKSAVPEGSLKTIDYAPVQYRYLRFTLWHSGSIIINEIELSGESSGQLIFKAAPGKSYKVYYGNPQATQPTYNLTGIYTAATLPYAQPTGEYVNSLFDADADDDGVGIQDNCPARKNPSQADADYDGVGNSCDNCVSSVNPGQEDYDNDGVGDMCDNCPSTYNPNQLDDDFNGIGYACDDADSDGIINSKDSCVQGYDQYNTDSNRNGIGDSCEDLDNDTIPTYADNCPASNPDQADTDKDGKGDMCDNCPLVGNPDQKDENADGVGDVCEDTDLDGVAAAKDNCPRTNNSDQMDWDVDGIGDLCDNCPSNYNPDQRDKDRDGIGDSCDQADNRALENKYIVWSIIILAIVVIGFLAYMAYMSGNKK